MFGGLNAFIVSDECNLQQTWEFSTALKKIKSLGVGEKVLIPSRMPHALEAMDSISFFMESNPAVFEVVAIAVQQTVARLTLKFCGKVDSPPGVQVDNAPWVGGPAFAVTIEKSISVVSIVVDTPFGSLLDRVGVESQEVEEVAQGDDGGVAHDIIGDEDESEAAHDDDGGEVALMRLRDDCDDIDTGPPAKKSRVHDIVPSTSELVVKEKGRFYIEDLDGGKRHSRLKAGLDKVLEHSNLFRLLSPLRLEVFLPDLRLDMGFWRKTLVEALTLSRHVLLNPSNGFGSLHLAQNCEELRVWRDDKLFEKFLKGEFSAFDWNELSLGFFLSLHDCNVVWGQAPTKAGRSRMISALSNLERMCGVNFDECFLGVFEKLRVFLDIDDRLNDFHDIFIRFHMEVMISSFFTDVGKRKRSVSYPDRDMRTPTECRDLLLVYVNDLITSFDTLERIPHHRFYSPIGMFKSVVLDPVTQSSLYGSSSNSVVHYDRRNHSLVASSVSSPGPNMARPPADPVKSVAISENGLCIWELG